MKLLIKNTEFALKNNKNYILEIDTITNIALIIKS